MDAALTMVKQFDPAMMFVNLGDVDRVGHADLTGTTLKAARNAALQSTNLQIGRFVDLLKSSGKLGLVDGDRARRPLDGLVAAREHRQPRQALRRGRLPQGELPDRAERRRRPRLLDRRELGPQCRADEDDRARAGRRGRLPGAPDRPGARLRLDAKAGDLLVYCEAGWRFSDPGPSSNPIPGNHGHPATEPIPFLVSGGSPAVRKGIARSAKAHTMDVAPTLGAYFGLKAPSTGWEGTSRL